MPTSSGRRLHQRRRLFYLVGSVPRNSSRSPSSTSRLRPSLRLFSLPALISSKSVVWPMLINSPVSAGAEICLLALRRFVGDRHDGTSAHEVRRRWAMPDGMGGVYSERGSSVRPPTGTRSLSVCSWRVCSPSLKLRARVIASARASTEWSCCWYGSTSCCSLQMKITNAEGSPVLFLSTSFRAPVGNPY